MLIFGTFASLGLAQGGGQSSSLAGSVFDTSGGVIPGADISVKNDATGAEYKTISAENGTFFIPALPTGTYTATVTMPNFKVNITKDIKLETGVPGSIRVTLQVGGSSETVVVEAGAEMVQSQTANITTTLGSKQIGELPLVTRNALDYIVLLPGVHTSGTSNRDSEIVGLPQSMINITIDGVNTQDNYNRSGDGFFTMLRAQLDAIEEVTVSTATPGAESAGAGAIQIKFVTRQGNNQYRGSLYEYHRNSALNANSWFNNRDVLAPPGADPLTWKASPARMLLN
jgi:hypothetical protein